MNNELPSFRVFVSSPGDVQPEREIAFRLLNRLAAEFVERCSLEAYFWEHEPMLATRDFQEQIPAPSTFDAVVCILWSRLGTRLHSRHSRPDGTAYGSGTEYEFEDAAIAALEKGWPELLVFANQKEVRFPASPREEREGRIAQYDALQGFFQKWFRETREEKLKAAFNTFLHLSDFEEQLESKLRCLVEEKVPLKERSATTLPPSWKKGSPFRSLACFEFEHAQLFFGRTKAIDQVLSGLRMQIAEGRAFTMVFGNSGGGKSSLLRAGLIPFLVRPGVIEGIGLWRRAIMRPAEACGELFVGLATALLSPEALPELAVDGTSPAALARMLREQPAGAGMLVKGALSQAASSLQRKENLERQPRARLVLGIDQLEELFTLDSITPQARSEFVQAIDSLARSGLVVVLATLRSDFFPRCGEIPALMALKEGRGQYHLQPPTPAEIGQMIRLPALAAGLRYEEDPTGLRLDDVLRDAGARHPSVLPLLQFLLEGLYQRRDSNGLLTFSAYRELGGVEGALGRRAEEVFQKLPRRNQEALATVFRTLATIDENQQTGFVRRRASLEDIARGEAKPLVEALVAERLLSTDRDERGGFPVIEVAHEALFEHWSTLHRFLVDERERLASLALLEQRADRWIAEGRSSAHLLPPFRPVREAMKLMGMPFLQLEAKVREFVLASLNHLWDIYTGHLRGLMISILGLLVLHHVLDDSPLQILALAYLFIPLTYQMLPERVQKWEQRLAPPLLIALIGLYLRFEIPSQCATIAYFQRLDQLPRYLWVHWIDVAFFSVYLPLGLVGTLTTWRIGFLLGPLSLQTTSVWWRVLSRIFGVPPEYLGEFFALSRQCEAGWGPSGIPNFCTPRTRYECLRVFILSPLALFLSLALCIQLSFYDSGNPPGKPETTQLPPAQVRIVDSALQEMESMGIFSDRRFQSYSPVSALHQASLTNDMFQVRLHDEITEESLKYLTLDLIDTFGLKKIPPLDRLDAAIALASTMAFRGDLDAMRVLARYLPILPCTDPEERPAHENDGLAWASVLNRLGVTASSGLMIASLSIQDDNQSFLDLVAEERLESIRVLQGRTALIRALEYPHHGFRWPRKKLYSSLRRFRDYETDFLAATFSEALSAGVSNMLEGREPLPPGLSPSRSEPSPASLLHLNRAIHLGNNQARFLFGTLLLHHAPDHGNRQKALDLLKEAAFNGDSRAQFFCGKILSENSATTEEKVESEVWFTLAEAFGSIPARERPAGLAVGRPQEMDEKIDLLIASWAPLITHRLFSVTERSIPFPCVPPDRPPNGTLSWGFGWSFEESQSFKSFLDVCRLQELLAGNATGAVRVSRKRTGFCSKYEEKVAQTVMYLDCLSLAGKGSLASRFARALFRTFKKRKDLIPETAPASLLLLELQLHAGGI